MEEYRASENSSESGLTPRQPQQIDENPKISSETTDAEKIEIIAGDQVVDIKGQSPKKDCIFPTLPTKRVFNHVSEKNSSKSNNGKREQEAYKEALSNSKDTLILVATLIATFAYSSGINPPGGVYQDGPLMGTAVAARRTAFKVFTVCNNLA
ncbi:hypothetical protein CDL12_18289 [Handroanthus impetiginosus]|uniref:PGG domain-containing protein n=1 Tax=Handroanthus impetiginosus TaxID=429701 RepID=A0A2G9GV29_9LAMI|nr:hypothetical protein CDL12_18289 [Handroanthus impetiginosus]